MDQQAGPLLDALGVTLDITDQQQLTEVLVIGKLADFEGKATPVVVGSSIGLDWVTQLGLLHAALAVCAGAEPVRYE